MRALPFRIVIPILLTAICSKAQWPDRLYPFRELTDEMRARIDLKDGSIEDWLEVLGEPTLTGLDFAAYPSDTYDPSSYDCRLWLAWHDATDHLFVAAEIVDDFYVHLDEWPLEYFGDAAVLFFVDGDKSGGIVVDNSSYMHMVHAQLYTAFARTYSNDSNVDLSHVSSTWMDRLPYADGGGAIVDSQPIFYVVEFFVTPFDRLIWDDPEESVIADLFEGKTIGFALSLADLDSEESSDPVTPDSWLELFGPDASRDQLYVYESDLWASGILLGADGTDGTAVESVSWARIKASLSE